MNNMILIRGDKVAFSKYPGDYGDASLNAHDLAELMTPYGLFIPIIDHGPQVVTMMNPSKTFNASDLPDIFGTPTGEKGLLIADIPDGVQWNRIKLSSGSPKRKLTSVPLLTGKHGHAILTPYDHLESMMQMCVRLTTTIEDSVNMYCKYAKTDKRKVLIWNKQDCKKFIKDNWTTALDIALEVASSE